MGRAGGRDGHGAPRAQAVGTRRSRGQGAPLPVPPQRGMQTAPRLLSAQLSAGPACGGLGKPPTDPAVRGCGPHGGDGASETVPRNAEPEWTGRQHPHPRGPDCLPPTHTHSMRAHTDTSHTHSMCAHICPHMHTQHTCAHTYVHSTHAQYTLTRVHAHTAHACAHSTHTCTTQNALSTRVRSHACTHPCTCTARTRP